MGNYALPTNTDYISSDYWDHRRRRPPSSEAGTDFGCAYGSPMYAPFDGTVVDVKHSNSGAMGRYAKINLDDGKGTRGIHGAEIWVAVGQRVHRGQQIGLTGASANGNNWGVGAHIHQTLWETWDYRFGDGATINFMDYVGPVSVAGHQRVVGANGANARSAPQVGAAKIETLPPGTIGDFNGWMRGDTVEGNNVWFRGAHSGNWFWSGGFTDSGTHDLPDLNPAPPAIQPDQRKVGPNGVRGRKDASTAAEVTQNLDPGSVWHFKAWKHGEGVEGNTVWFQGRDSGDWFWSGGFEDRDTHNLVDANPPAPPASANRVVGANSANVRAVPWLTSPSVASEVPAAAVEVVGWGKAEVVEGNGVWFMRKDQRWMWSGGFTSASTEGLPEMAVPPKPDAGSIDQLNNPAGLVMYPPVWEGADFGLEAPLGFQEDGSRAVRTEKGKEKTPTTGIISFLGLHWTGVTPDQLYYFSTKNDRDVCPSYYTRTSGKTFEMIRPGFKPATTGPEWNWRHISFEMQMAATSPTISRAQQEKAAQMAVRMQEATLLEGGIFDGAKIDFLISRATILGHNEMLPGTTTCPGPDMDIDWIVARALEIWDEKHPDDPTPEPDPEWVQLKRTEAEEMLAAADYIAKTLRASGVEND
jgi:hypothetical protein